jgi:hypothetical protein
MNQEDEMCSQVNKANNEKISTVVVYDYNPNMGAIHLRDQMLQPYLLEQMKVPGASKWYMKLFKRLHNIVIHSSVIVYQSMPDSKRIDSLKFRLLLIQGLI